MDNRTKEEAKDLTTEGLRKLFKNNFELAHFAIRMGRFCIRGGEGEGSLSNILDEVKRNPNPSYLDDLEMTEREGIE